MQPFLDQAPVQGMEQIDDSVYCDSNSEADDNDKDDDNTFQDAIQVEDVIDSTDDDDDDTTIYGEPINNDFIAPIGTEDGATGVMIEHEGILYTQYCHYGELYYQSCKVYGDDPTKTKEAIDVGYQTIKLWIYHVHPTHKKCTGHCLNLTSQ